MTRSRTAVVLAILLGGLAVVALLASGERGPWRGAPVQPASYAPPPEPDPASGGASLNGLDFTGLSPAQVSTVVQILNENRCNCSCGMTLGECRSKDPNCGRSLTLGRQVVEDVKAGKERATIQTRLTETLAKLQTAPPATPPPAPPPDPNKVFRIDTAGSPYKGAKGASVTIVEFSDYQ